MAKADCSLTTNNTDNNSLDSKINQSDSLLIADCTNIGNYAEVFDLPIVSEQEMAKISHLLVVYPQNIDLSRAMQVVGVLEDLGMSQIVIEAGFLARAYLRKLPMYDLIVPQLNKEVLSILSDLDKIAIIDKLHEKDQQHVEKLRQMLLAVANDVRVVVVKLAWQLVTMKNLSRFSEDERRKFALQTRDIFAPLANRLGIAKIKWELEDLALQELEPTTYKLISDSLSEQRRSRENYINSFISIIKEKLAEVGVNTVNTYGRAKHINSIYSKMKKKNKRLEEIYDLLALRIHVENVKDCYLVLSVIHGIWEHIPSEFDDYIVKPKPNGYQSLHTAIIGPKDRVIEIQIRTNAMHEYAELGVAAHWRYKENNNANVSSFDQQINWLRRMLDSKSEDLVEEFASEIKEDKVYVVTPKGQVFDLPEGSTPLDLAYLIHTELGHRTRGALVNGVMVPITYHLKTSDNVEILTGAKPQPSRDWLVKNLGYLHTPKARSKVRAFFKHLEKDKAIEEGKNLLENELNKLSLKLSEKIQQHLIDRFNVKSFNDVYSGIGFGDITISQIITQFQHLSESERKDIDDIKTRLSRIPIRNQVSQKGNVIIEGISDLFISIASCCSPVSPDEILGFITKTKGVSIHRKSCLNLLALQKTEPEKIIEVRWNDNSQGFSAKINVQATDRVGLLRDVSQVLANENIIIHQANFERDEDNVAVLQLQVSIRDLIHLNRCLDRLRQVRNVIRAFRINASS